MTHAVWDSCEVERSINKAHLEIKSLHSWETKGFDGKLTCLAFSITSPLRIISCVRPSPKGRLPYSIWYRMTAADQTSTCVLRVLHTRRIIVTDIPFAV